jgi:hypothetical protein
VDTVRYTDAVQSRSVAFGSGYDTVSGFDGSADKFDLADPVTFDGTIFGTLSKATFNANLESAASGLQTGHAAIFIGNAGNLMNSAFLLVNTDGNVGYQGGSDLLVRFATAGEALTVGQTSFI